MVEGCTGLRFMKRLKFIKSNLKLWNREVFGAMRLRKKEILHKLDSLGSLEQQRGLDEGLCFKDLIYLMSLMRSC